jgi:hypothetical protein
VYYESIPHTSFPVASATAAAHRIRTGQAASFHALIWRNSRQERIAAVADGGLDHPWFEVAVLNLDTQRQLESITFGWIQQDALAAACLVSCQESPGLSARPISLPMDGAGLDVPSQFDCSCCGEIFRSTIAEQQPHGLDEGHGYCPACLDRLTMKEKKKTKSAPICVFCGRSSGAQFAIFNPRFQPFGTACTDCEATLPPGTVVPSLGAQGAPLRTTPHAP